MNKYKRESVVAANFEHRYIMYLCKRERPHDNEYH
jgi:hypothetical protein